MNRFNAYSVQMLLNMLPKSAQSLSLQHISLAVARNDRNGWTTHSINYPCITPCLAELHAHVSELIARSINRSA